MLRPVFRNLSAVGLIALSGLAACAPGPASQAVPAAPVPVEATRDTVRKVQTALKARGCEPGPADGVICARTTEALRSFESANGMAADGVIDTAVLAALTAPDVEPTSAAAAQNAEPPQQQASARSRYPENWTPLGPIASPGCEGLEVVEYFERSVGAGMRFFYMGVRNNTSSARLIEVYVKGWTRPGGSRANDKRIFNVPAGELFQVELDMNNRPPHRAQAVRCL
jgi:peptidoglycan hydrolase-like protein with peptidoglycan-binding domain